MQSDDFLDDNKEDDNQKRLDTASKIAPLSNLDSFALPCDQNNYCTNDNAPLSEIVRVLSLNLTAPWSKMHNIRF